MPVPRKILIVDDSAAEGKLMQSYLEQAGYSGGCSSAARPYRADARHQRPSLILLDVVMPVRNGIQACRELKAQAEYAPIPIVMVTSKGTVSDQFWGREQGAEGYVVKPFTREQLIEEVERVLGKLQSAAAGAVSGE